MPRFYFDIHDGEFQRDEEGLECGSFEEAREKVIAGLPGIAELLASDGGDSQAVTVMVRDENGSGVYKATLTFAGRRLD